MLLEQIKTTKDCNKLIELILGAFEDKMKTTSDILETMLTEKNSQHGGGNNMQDLLDIIYKYCKYRYKYIKMNS